LFAGAMARAQQTPSPAKLAATTPAVNKTTCEKSVAKIGTPAQTVTTADLFAAMDLNGEAKNALQASIDRFVIASRLRALDANDDGMLSAAEFKVPKAEFTKYDRDKNGLIGPVEYATMIQERAAAHAAMRVATAKPVPTPAKPVAVVTKTNVAKPVKIDQDKDGYITASDPAKVAALRQTKATSTPVVATPAKTLIKPATLKPAQPAAAKTAKTSTTAIKPLAPADVLPPSKVDVSFDEIDVNHDGVLTRTEIKVYLAKQPQKSTTTTVSHRKG